MRVDKSKSYKQKYNEEHYRQVNMRVPTELFERFNLKKVNYGSAPKLLEAGLDAIEETNHLNQQIENLSRKIEDFKKKPIIPKNTKEKSILEYVIEYREPLFFGFMLGGLVTIFILCILSGRIWN